MILIKTKLFWGMVVLGLAAGCRSSGLEPTAPFANGPPGTTGSTATTNNRQEPTAPPPAPATMDRETAKLIRQTLKRDPALAQASGDIGFSVDRGVVTLRGMVPTEQQRAELVRRIGQVAGVDRVEDQLRVGQR